MHKDKFLTVYAVFDESTQAKLSNWQNKIFKVGICGKQSMDIPFHISLGSFDVAYKDELIERIQRVTKDFPSFELQLVSVQTFGSKVLFVEPDKSNEITELHNMFDCNFADGLPFVPHVTMLIGDDDEVMRAKETLTSCFTSIRAAITEIHLSEFFPTKFIYKQTLCNSK